MNVSLRADRASDSDPLSTCGSMVLIPTLSTQQTPSGTAEDGFHAKISRNLMDNAPYKTFTEGGKSAKKLLAMDIEI